MEDPTQYRKNRIAFAEEWRCGDGSYGEFQVSTGIHEFCRSFCILDPGQRGTAVVSVAGRVKSLRASGRKLRFYGLETAQGDLQAVASFADFQDGNEESFVALHGVVRRGDIIGVRGTPGRTKHGELSIFVTELLLLAPCFHMLPKGGRTKEEEESWTPGKPRQLNSYILRDPETRYRRRYLDIITNPQIKSVFLARASALRYLRRFLYSYSFVEVETAVLNTKAGGAAAKPFVTQCHSSNSDMVLRIAPELPLKTLLVAGYSGVFEIGKQFRNEGIDLTHNPEFTTCEFYKAYADYNDLMQMTEELLSGMVKELTGGFQILYHSDGLDNPPVTIDFTPPFRRISMLQELESVMGLKFPEDLASAETSSFLKAVCEERGVECSPPRTTARLLDKLVGHYLETTCVNPTFIVDHPLISSPLAKRHRSMPGLTERFELFVNKHELVNAYTELNDPVDQRERFYEQMKDRQVGDEEAMVADEDFVTALEYGLPPCAGWGMGIDRLAMLLTDSLNIKEVLLSPAMKPDMNTEVKPDVKPDAGLDTVADSASSTTTSSEETITEEEIISGDCVSNPKKYYEERLSFVNSWRASASAYPHKFEVSMDLAGLENYLKGSQAGQRHEEVISVAGRVMTKRGYRELLLESAHGSVEAFVRDSLSSLDFSAFKRGDVVGLTGNPGKTDKGSICIFVTDARLLAPCLHLIPKNGALDQGMRYKQRYLDIILSSRANSVVFTRDSIFRYVRDFLHGIGFVEVETAVLNKSIISGSGASRPFVTHHNELDIDMFMRMSSALQLKLMIIAGYAGVYEIGKQFRNEAADSTHNPELTACEFYKAYASYNDFMKITEDLISGLVTSINGGTKISLSDGREIDFSPPFRRIDLIDGLQAALGLEFPDDLESEEANAFLRNVTEKHGIKCASPATTATLLEMLAERFLGGAFENPTFIVDYPILSSTTKKHRTKPGRGESFQLIVNKLQLVNGQSEVNDPLEQKARLRTVDEDLITALEHGLPPCAGMSLEMDRLVMLLSGFDTVKDALLY